MPLEGGHRVHRVIVIIVLNIVVTCPAASCDAKSRFAVSDSNGARPTVLRGLDLDVGPGETLALVGRSGAGKSTLLKLINRLLLPDARRRARAKAREHARVGSVRAPAADRLRHAGSRALSAHDRRGRTSPSCRGCSAGTTARIAARVDELLELVGLPPATYRARAGPTSSRADSASASASRARWPPIRRSC